MEMPPQQSCGISARDSLRSPLLCCVAELRGIRPQEIKSIIPKITGSAYITGFNQWLLDEG